MYDIAIVGAGPAGSTLARLVSKRYRVLLVDRRKMSEPYDGGPNSKCCGGLLAPDAQKVLGIMGLALPQDVLVGPQIFVVRTIDLKQRLERYYQRFYINLDREKFDRWLFSLVPGEVDVRSPAICKDVRPDTDTYLLQLVQDGRVYEEQARCVIGADGAASIVRKKLFACDPHLVMYAAVQEWFAPQEALPHFSVFFDADLTDFYGWTIPKGNALLLGAALCPRQPTRVVFGNLKQKLEGFGYRLRDCVRREGAYLVRPTRPPRRVTAAPAAALIGEAAGWISPSSAEGFSYAFRSALITAECLNQGLDGFAARLDRKTAPLRRSLFIKNVKRPFMYHPLLRALVMRSALESVSVLTQSRE